MRTRLVAVVAAAAFITAAFVGAAVFGAGSGGCEQAIEPSFATDKFTPFEGRLSPPPLRPILSGGVILPVVPGDRSVTPYRPLVVRLLQGTPTMVLLGSEGLLQIFFGVEPVGNEMTLEEFMVRGGVHVAQQPSFGVDAGTVVETVGDRATVLWVGDHDAAIVHGDPMAGGTRTYSLYWSDGERFVTVAGTDAITVIDAARSMYCP